MQHNRYCAKNFACIDLFGSTSALWTGYSHHHSHFTKENCKLAGQSSLLNWWNCQVNRSSLTGMNKSCLGQSCSWVYKHGLQEREVISRHSKDLSLHNASFANANLHIYNFGENISLQKQSPKRLPSNLEDNIHSYAWRICTGSECLQSDISKGSLADYILANSYLKFIFNCKLMLGKRAMYNAIYNFVFTVFFSGDERY